MLTIRPAQLEDSKNLARLSHLAFAPTDPFATILERAERNPAVLLSSFVAQEERILGKYVLFDFQTYLAGQLFPMGGIGGVAVAPEGRGRGVGTALIHHAVKTMHERGQAFSMLYGFRHGFYRRLGWACVGEVYRYQIRSRDLPRFSDFSQVRALDRDQDRVRIEALYACEANKHNGWLVRSERQWQTYFQPDSLYQAFGYEQNGNLEGYLLLSYKKRSPDSNEIAHLAVREWVASTSRGYRGLLGFLAAQRDQIDTVVWDTDRDDPLPKLLSEQRHAHDETIRTFLHETGFGAIHSSFMWRVVNLAQALGLRPVNPGPNFTLNLEVHDPILGRQHQTIAIEEGKMHVTHAPAQTTLKLSMDLFTQLWCGSWTAQSAHWSGILEVEGDTSLLPILDRAWQTPPPFSWDYF